VPTYILEYLGNGLLDYVLTDINGQRIDLNDYRDKHLIIEVAGSWCSHCKDQALLYTDELLEAYPDIVFIQYFNEGSINEIKGFYAEIMHPLPDNVMIIPEDAEFSSRLLSTYNPKYYPGFLLFNEGRLSWIKVSSLTKEEMDLVYDLAYVNSLSKDDLTDEDGTSIFSYKRTKNDVISDLGEENYALLKSLDNDGRTIDNTLSYIGKDFGYRSQYENESAFTAETDFLDYEERDLVIIYCTVPDERSVRLINDFYAANPDVGVLVLNVTDQDNEKMAELLDPPVVSIMNQVPRILNEIVFDSYPSALYVKKGIISGAFSNIKDISLFNRSVDIFLRDTSIALVRNAQSAKK
ncbi:MAG: hypothetical protein IKE38_05075, partial [Erysipelotrichaceae bacterium]|nr:hypothetical protein [Erysipelotrichaceae bacterium]